MEELKIGGVNGEMNGFMEGKEKKLDEFLN